MNIRSGLQCAAAVCLLAVPSYSAILQEGDIYRIHMSAVQNASADADTLSLALVSWPTNPSLTSANAELFVDGVSLGTVSDSYVNGAVVFSWKTTASLWRFPYDPNNIVNVDFAKLLVGDVIWIDVRVVGGPSDITLADPVSVYGPGTSLFRAQSESGKVGLLPQPMVTSVEVITAEAVPEPATSSLVIGGTVLAAIRARKRRQYN